MGNFLEFKINDLNLFQDSDFYSDDLWTYNWTKFVDPKMQLAKLPKIIWTIPIKIRFVDFTFPCTVLCPGHISAILIPPPSALWSLAAINVSCRWKCHCHHSVVHDLSQSRFRFEGLFLEMLLVVILYIWLLISDSISICTLDSLIISAFSFSPKEILYRCNWNDRFNHSTMNITMIHLLFLCYV